MDALYLFQHSVHADVARVGHFRTPVTNFFLLLYLSSLIPDLDHEYLRFSDDYFLLRPYAIGDARRVRYLQDLSRVKSRDGRNGERCALPVCPAGGCQRIG